MGNIGENPEEWEIIPLTEPMEVPEPEQVPVEEPEKVPA